MSNYTGDQKAAVLAALLAGQSVNQVAKDYNVPRSTVSRWKNEPGTGIDGIQKKDDIGGLVLHYLEANLQALRAQALVFADPVWLRQQDASSVAVLHGVMTDKAIRLIEAMSKQE